MAKIIVLQFDPQTHSVSENMEYICRHVSSYHEALVVLPELFLSSYSHYELMPSKELRSILAPLIKLCRENDLCFAGSLPVSTREGNYNRGIYLTKEGLQKKDKTRLFGIEQTSMVPGKAQPIFFYHKIAFSLQICLDIIDPSIAYKLARRGVQLIINPATVSVDFLRTINKARALENGITTIFCNRSGNEHDGISYLGQSSVFYAGGSEETIREVQGMLIFNL